MPEKPIQNVLRAHTDRLMAIPGVTGTGIGLREDEPCIVVFVVRKSRELAEKIPSTLGGHTVDIRETGPFRARDAR